MRTGNNSSGPGRWLARIAVRIAPPSFRLTATSRATAVSGKWFTSILLSALLFAGPAFCWGSSQHSGRVWSGPRGHFSGFQSQNHRGQTDHGNNERGRQGRPEVGRRGGGPQQQQHENRPPYRPSYRPSDRRGGPGTSSRAQEHLPAWWQAHRSLSPQQQADALRRQPGFRNLPRGQQQRLIQRLQDFDRRPPVEQRRMLDRMEMFERLSPERQQQVRGASQALSRMSPERQRVIRHAFHDLRGMPPDERRRMLHSGYGAQFTPQEQTVLGNLLSIEPYQPQGQIIQPYFGK